MHDKMCTFSPSSIFNFAICLLSTVKTRMGSGRKGNEVKSSIIVVEFDWDFLKGIFHQNANICWLEGSASSLSHNNLVFGEMITLHWVITFYPFCGLSVFAMLPSC